MENESKIGVLLSEMVNKFDVKPGDNNDRIVCLQKVVFK